MVGVAHHLVGALAVRVGAYGAARVCRRSVCPPAWLSRRMHVGLKDRRGDTPSAHRLRQQTRPATLLGASKHSSFALQFPSAKFFFSPCNLFLQRYQGKRKDDGMPDAFVARYGKTKPAACTYRKSKTSSWTTCTTIIFVVLQYSALLVLCVVLCVGPSARKGCNPQPAASCISLHVVFEYIDPF